MTAQSIQTCPRCYGIDRRALVYVPSRGFPRITVETGHGWLVCYRVRGDAIEQIGRDATAHGLSAFREKTAGALPVIAL